MKRIEGRARTVRELLDSAKYTIDFYQREYAWQERQVRELMDDLTGKFLNFYDSSHARHEVENYGHYFLGSIVISHKRNQRFIVDGQQRLTTLSLLLIYLDQLQGSREARVEIAKLIYSEKFGRKSFNLDVEDRNVVMQKLLNGDPIDIDGERESVQNIVLRYRNIADHFPEELQGDQLPYFVDWLLENVHLVEIEAYSDEDAYTIFETMNDRGLSLSLSDMLKGYMLANIRHEDDQRAVNTLWKTHMQSLKDVDEDADSIFFKSWLRARHAETIRPGRKGAENKDYERIGSEFHRWIRDHKEDIGLTDSDSFVDFVKTDLDFYAKQTLLIRNASRTLTDGLESIYYNHDRAFTLQSQAILAPLSPKDPPADTRRKIQMVADYLDIWLARRVWNFRTIAYSSIKYTIFVLTKELRDRNLESLSHFLRAQLEEQVETFAGQTKLRLHQQNYRQIRHVLARLTYWVDSECGLAAHFPDLVSQGKARPFEIEHLWANHYDRFTEFYDHPADFDLARNHLGGLILLQRGLNQSLGDATYENKLDAYVSKGENLLARSLHPLSYQNNPGFKQLIERTDLPFHAHDRFGPEEQRERQELYIRLAEWVWNPSRVDLDGVKPPMHRPIGATEDEEREATSVSKGERHVAFREFWQQLLPVANERLQLHAGISPQPDRYLVARQRGVLWAYALLTDAIRVELYLEFRETAANKAMFDGLHAERQPVESSFGKTLLWQRMDDKRSCRISYTLGQGGWTDASSWQTAIPAAVDAMARLYEALAPRVEALRE